MKRLVALAALGAALGLLACGDDDADGTGSGGSSNGGSGGASNGGASSGEGGAPNDDTLCSRGCVETLAAECQNGPTSQAECESDCEALAAGSCGTEYRAFQECAEGEAISCSASGLPTVAACSEEQQAFIECL